MLSPLESLTSVPFTDVRQKQLECVAQVHIVCDLYMLTCQLMLYVKLLYEHVTYFYS